MTIERTIPPPHPDPHPPTRFTPPPNATNAHCHVFGPADKFPFAPDRSYTPPDSGYDRFVAHQQRLGLEIKIGNKTAGGDNGEDAQPKNIPHRVRGEIKDICRMNQGFHDWASSAACEENRGGTC